MADDDQPAESTSDQAPDPLAPYRAAVAEGADGFAATLWGSPETQRLRFGVLADLLGRRSLEGARVLDLGSGHGDLAAWCADEGIELAAYIGLDGVAEQVERGNARGLANAEFHHADLLDPGHDLALELKRHRADVAIISGTLNTMTDAQARAIVTSAWDAVRDAIAFNFLGDRIAASWRQNDLGPARRFDTLEWIRFAVERTPNVAMRQDHMGGHDVAIMMRR